MTQPELPSAFRPLVCADLELSRPVTPDDIPARAGLQLLVRLHGDPLGVVVIEPAEVVAGVESWCAAAVTAFAEPVRLHLSTDGIVVDGWNVGEIQAATRLPVTTCRRRLVPAPPLPTVAIVLCTLGVRALLSTCVNALLDQDYDGGYEVIVVDNEPDTGATRRALASITDPRLRIISEPIKGVSRAKNLGIASTDADLVLLTDDDVVVDGGWVRSTVAVFAEDPRITAVTGLVMPGSLLTRPEQWFELACGFGKGYQRAVWSTSDGDESLRPLGPRGDGGPLFPFSAGYFGSGNSVAFRTQRLREMGGFDPALGPGTPTRAGEDLDVFVRVLTAGDVLVYEPRVLIRHFHRGTASGLRHQMSNYGVGLSAFLTKAFLTDHAARRRLLTLVPQGAYRMLSTRSSKNARKDATFPKEVSRVELVGFLKGPFRYLSACREVRRVGPG